MDKAKLIALLKSNWKFIALGLIMIGSVGGVVKFQKGERFEIYVILPDELPDIFRGPEAKAATESISQRGLTALRMAGVRLREGDTDDSRKLYAVLQRLHNDPTCLPEIEVAVQRTQLDPLTLSLIAKIALRVAIVYLERRAPRTESEWDDRLLALLKLFADRPSTINAAHAVVIQREP